MNELSFLSTISLTLDHGRLVNYFLHHRQKKKISSSYKVDLLILSISPNFMQFFVSWFI